MGISQDELSARMHPDVLTPTQEKKPIRRAQWSPHLVQLWITFRATALVAGRATLLLLRHGWQRAPLLALASRPDLNRVGVSRALNLLEQRDHSRLEV